MLTDNWENNLLLQIASGNQFAFRKLFTMHHQHLGNYIFRITDSMELAEEIVQDVFMKIWLNREKLTEVKNFKAYLFVISKNQALNSLRKMIKERALITNLENILNQDQDDNDLSEYYRLIDEAIDQLPPQQQKVYLLSRHKRLKYVEISDEMNISSETVKKYLKIANSSIIAHVRANLESILLLVLLYKYL